MGDNNDVSKALYTITIMLVVLFTLNKNKATVCQKIKWLLYVA